jgi:hypothetical protein
MQSEARFSMLGTAKDAVIQSVWMVILGCDCASLCRNWQPFLSLFLSRDSMLSVEILTLVGWQRPLILEESGPTMSWGEVISQEWE